eukprot:TRINITY_DN121325_c0_g1_i1.p1 TRINITY_DN121325_c0_g1~~TRINITY_DN121325_c0_g1_i1.p1  ORF type:complete len:475 (+),score=69.18 TRINITY_DN121325_c0_g1_i1:142-1566(+)
MVPWGSDDDVAAAVSRTLPGQQLAPPPVRQPVLARVRNLEAALQRHASEKKTADTHQKEGRKVGTQSRRPQSVRESSRNEFAASLPCRPQSARCRRRSTERSGDLWASFSSTFREVPAAAGKKADIYDDAHRWVPTSHAVHKDSSASYGGWKSPRGASSEVPTRLRMPAGVAGWKPESGYNVSKPRIHSPHQRPDDEPGFQGRPDRSGMIFAGKSNTERRVVLPGPAQVHDDLPPPPQLHQDKLAGSARKVLDRQSNTGSRKTTQQNGVNLRNAPGAYHAKWAQADAVKIQTQGQSMMSTKLSTSVSAPSSPVRRRKESEPAFSRWDSAAKTIPETKSGFCGINRGAGMFQPGFSDPITGRHLPEAMWTVDDADVRGSGVRHKSKLSGWKVILEKNRDENFVRTLCYDGEQVLPRKVLDAELGATVKVVGSPRNPTRRREQGQPKPEFFKSHGPPMPSTLGSLQKPSQGKKAKK